MKAFRMIIALAALAVLSVTPVQASVNNANYYNFVTDGEIRPYAPADYAATPEIPLIPRADAGWDIVRYYFPRYSTAVVRDILTGRSFEVKRTFGGQHADVEPLTEADTEIMYEIWGGWSWDRRAVVVYVGQYVFAGSLAGMPHAGVDSAPVLAVVNNLSGGFGRGQNLDMVKGNGMDGHVCLHFAGSRIHGSNAINAAHQTRVREAAAYILANY